LPGKAIKVAFPPQKSADAPIVWSRLTTIMGTVQEDGEQRLRRLRQFSIENEVAQQGDPRPVLISEQRRLRRLPEVAGGGEGPLEGRAVPPGREWRC
jgi:hypothetical protein